MKELPPAPRPEDHPEYRQLKPEHRDVMRRAGNQRYAFASAHLFAPAQKPARPRYAVM